MNVNLKLIYLIICPMLLLSERSLKETRSKNLNRIVLAHLNINSLRKKFNILTNQITGNVGVMVISETKLKDSFPASQFKIPGYSSPFRLDRDQNDSFIISVYVCEDIIPKVLSFEDKPIKLIFIKLNFSKKWLLSCSNNPNKKSSQINYNG